MAYLVGFLSTFIFWGAVVGYALFVLHRFGAFTDPQPRGWRLGLLYLASLFGLVAFIAAMLLVGHVGGFVYCSVQFSPTDPWPCSVGGRLLYAVVSLGIGLPLFALWMRFVNRRLRRDARP